MKKKVYNTKLSKGTSEHGYPPYSADDDIYCQYQEEEKLNPEYVSKYKKASKTGTNNEKDFKEDVSGGDIDVPGSAL